MSQRVVIVGGGLAGLAAAAGLATAGVKSTLLESRPRLGGRAGSFLDAETGEWIDTCQHVSMGCCTNLAHFARLVGINDLFTTQQELLFIGPGGERCRFRDRARPAPFHLTKAFDSLTWFSKDERRRLMRDVARLAHRRWSVDRGLSFEQWLDEHAQTADLRERFWEVILVSALSETAGRISVPHARKVFVDGFLAHRDGWRVQIPTVPLDELYGRRLTDWLSSRGVDITTGAGVAGLEERDGLVTGVRLRSGEQIPADEVVLAVPWHRALDLVPDALAEHPSLAGVGELESAPITSVHLWFDRAVLDVPHAVLVGRLSQWVFRRAGLQSPATDLTVPSAPASLDSQPSTINHRPSTHDLQTAPLNPHADYVQVVISASTRIARQSQMAIIDQVVGELAAIWPQVREAQLISSRVVTEHRAVFSPRPGVDALRPPQSTPIANLQLAGDWTRTDWPATMESAVKSGFLAAENTLTRLGAARSLVQPPLKPGWLARLLLRV
jgi:squalene-associated FAD-dependent desaturase